MVVSGRRTNRGRREMTAETNAYGKGNAMGWADALAYTLGTRRTRKAIRRRIAKGAESYAPFWEGYRSAFRDRAEQRAEAIRAGLIARTINPHKLARVLDRTLEAAS